MPRCFQAAVYITELNLNDACFQWAERDSLVLDESWATRIPSCLSCNPNSFNLNPCLAWLGPFMIVQWGD